MIRIFIFPFRSGQGNPFTANWKVVFLNMKLTSIQLKSDSVELQHHNENDDKSCTSFLLSNHQLFWVFIKFSSKNDKHILCLLISKGFRIQCLVFHHNGNRSVIILLLLFKWCRRFQLTILSVSVWQMANDWIKFRFS